jgi:hypothetical protein
MPTYPVGLVGPRRLDVEGARSEFVVMTQLQPGFHRFVVPSSVFAIVETLDFIVQTSAVVTARAVQVEFVIPQVVGQISLLAPAAQPPSTQQFYHYDRNTQAFVVPNQGMTAQLPGTLLSPGAFINARLLLGDVGDSIFSPPLLLLTLYDQRKGTRTLPETPTVTPLTV